MIIIRGKYNEAKVFTKNLEKTARDQIQTLCDQPFVQGSKIRIMPDVHAGAGCTIGTTMTIDDKSSRIWSVSYRVRYGDDRLLTRISILKRLINSLGVTYLPDFRSGENLTATTINQLEKLRCREGGKTIKRPNGSRRTAPRHARRGNHFIEINRDENDRLPCRPFGSRNLGLQVALYYQRKASSLHPHLPRDLAYLDGRWFDDYLHDMQLIQQFAVLNRKAIVDELVQGMKLRYDLDFTTIHNYIDLNRMILRKGAISALKGERILIPLNMRDALICEGLAILIELPAPHGAGRVMSRTEARKTL